MKKLISRASVFVTAAMLCTAMNVFAEPYAIVPVGCPVQGAPCAQNQPCNCGKPECPKCCDSAPVFNSCEEIQACLLYTSPSPRD